MFPVTFNVPPEPVLFIKGVFPQILALFGDSSPDVERRKTFFFPSLSTSADKPRGVQSTRDVLTFTLPQALGSALWANPRFFFPRMRLPDSIPSLAFSRLLAAPFSQAFPAASSQEEQPKRSGGGGVVWGGGQGGVAWGGGLVGRGGGVGWGGTGLLPRGGAGRVGAGGGGVAGGDGGGGGGGGASAWRGGGRVRGRGGGGVVGWGVPVLWVGFRGGGEARAWVGGVAEDSVPPGMRVWAGGGRGGERGGREGGGGGGGGGVGVPLGGGRAG